MKKSCGLLGLMILFFGLAAGCSNGNKETIINYPTFQTGVNTAAPVIDQLIAEFNQQYKGKYRIVKEDVPGDANYFDKIKVQLGVEDLPPVIYGAGYNLLDLALAKDAALDLTPYVEKDAEWKALYSEAGLTANSRNGKIYASSAEGSVIGYFYNKELFSRAGISAPAATWDEFFSQCDKLKAAGITPLSMDTANSAWVTTLWLGALVGTANSAGFAFMQQMNPDNYSTPEMIQAVTRIQEMFKKYTTKDAVGGKYENAANNFLSGETAMIANGPWMIGDFSDTSMTSAGFADKVGTAIYPGSFVYDAPIQGFIVTKQKNAALEEASLEMVKFFTGVHAQEIALEMQGMVPSAPGVQISASVRQKWPLLAEFLDQAKGARYSSDNLQATMYANLLDIVSQELPRLASGNISAEQFCRFLTEGAAKNK